MGRTFWKNQSSVVRRIRSVPICPPHRVEHADMAKRPRPLIDCIYCGKNAPSSREHVVQYGIGGGDILPDVCHSCNQSFSKIDKELAIHSPLSILARRELNKVGPKLTWDVDERRSGLLLEGRQTHLTDSMTLLPQIVFDEGVEIFYDDQDEIDRLGIDAIQQQFFARLKDAVALYDIAGPSAKKRDHRGRDMLKLEHTKTIRPGYRYPPRVCAPTNIAEYDDEVMFELRYQDEADVDIALTKLRKLKWDVAAMKAEIQLGCDLPEVHLSFVPELVIRAVTKIGMNLLAKFCKVTNPNASTYAATVAWIKYREHANLYGNHKTYGFIKPDGIVPLACPMDAHKFRLTYNTDIERWMMYAAFFGGKAAAFVSIFGPNNESWKTLDVIAPYGKPLLTPKFDSEYKPLDVQVTIDGTEILPGLQFTNGETRIRKERVKRSER